MFPDGNVYAGEHQLSAPGNGMGSLIARMVKNDKGALAKSIPSSKLGALAASVAKNPGMSLNAAVSIANATNLTHLQLIRLLPEAQGVPDEYFFLEEMFVKRDVPQLEYRETFYDTTATAKYLRRMEESKATDTKYDEIKYDLPKLVDSVYTPIEDIFRTIINPQQVDLSQLNWGFKWKRNQSALAALGQIGNTQSAIGKFESIGAGELHSDNRSAKELNELFNQFLKANDVSITHVAMNTKLFTEYTENTWTKSGPLDLNPIRLAGGGVVPLPGIQGVTAVVDVSLPDNTIYAVNKPNALRLGEGPKIMRRYYDEHKDAEAIKMLDFHQHLSVDNEISKLSRKFRNDNPCDSIEVVFFYFFFLIFIMGKNYGQNRPRMHDLKSPGDIVSASIGERNFQLSHYDEQQVFDHINAKLDIQEAKIVARSSFFVR